MILLEQLFEKLFIIARLGGFLNVGFELYYLCSSFRCKVLLTLTLGASLDSDAQMLVPSDFFKESESLELLKYDVNQITGSYKE
jgi:hypothetical protein